MLYNYCINTSSRRSVIAGQRFGKRRGMEGGEMAVKERRREDGKEDKNLTPTMQFKNVWIFCVIYSPITALLTVNIFISIGLCLLLQFALSGRGTAISQDMRRRDKTGGVHSHSSHLMTTFSQTFPLMALSVSSARQSGLHFPFPCLHK